VQAVNQQVAQQDSSANSHQDSQAPNECVPQCESTRLQARKQTLKKIGNWYNINLQHVMVAIESGLKITSIAQFQGSLSRP
jgi:hypothetical protein